jgi:hypothetical protein
MLHIYLQILKIVKKIRTNTIIPLDWRSVTKKVTKGAYAYKLNHNVLKKLTLSGLSKRENSFAK